MNKRKQCGNRRHPAHQMVFEQVNRSTIIFVTVCAKDRKPIFAKPIIHDLIVQSWHKAHLWIVGRYIIMPDHIHFFCTPTLHEYPALKKWIQYWKALVSRKWPVLNEQPIWQQDFWDTQLRTGDSYSEKWHYMQNNPVRAGFVEKAEDWPFQGELEKLFWHH